MSSTSHLPSRREFLKSAAISAGYVGTGGLALHGCSPVEHQDTYIATGLFEVFSQPPKEARPFFRWWWNGNALSKEEISRELRLIKESGAGGVEINPIAMPEEVQDSDPGLVWLDRAWCEMLVHAVQEAGNLDLVTDLIVGTGWPFGGEFIHPEETLQGLTFESIHLDGPGRQSVKVGRPQSESEKVQQLVLFRDDFKSLTDQEQISPDTLQNGMLEVDLDDGPHTLVIVRWRNNFRTVYYGSPGGAGPVIDHFNARAVRKYLDHMSDTLKPFFNNDIGSSIRSLFCDSIELEGANYTTDLFQEFQERRGYDVEPYLPYLHIEQELLDAHIREEIRRIRYDFSVTLSEFLAERFINTYHEWCHDNNTLSRYQAYGHPWLYTDMIDGFMIPDIPEGDQWLFNAGWSHAKIDDIRYGIWNKYASSGGNLANRKIISSEAMTNVRGVFRSTLEYIKQATDLNFVAGINHLVLHGYNYSPPDAGFPGWVRFGTYFNEKNPWWSFFPSWANYASRLSAVFQNSGQVSQAAILGPTADVWSDWGLDRNPFNMTPWYLHSFWQALNHNGICSDYVNGRIINEGSIEDGKLISGNMCYSTLLVCDVETLDPYILEKILDYLNKGLKVVFIGKKPAKAPGFKDYEERDKKVIDLSHQIFAAGACFAEAPDQEKIDPHQGLSNWTKMLMDECEIKPGVSMVPNSASIFFIQRVRGDTDLYFVVNTDREKTIKVELNLNRKDKKVWRWFPETLEREFLSGNSANDLSLQLSPLESALLVADQTEGEIPDEDGPTTIQPFELTGDWSVQCRHAITQEEYSAEFSRLQDLAKVEALKYFSGRIEYTLRFDLKNTDYRSIDPGEVYDIAEILINDVPVGTRWWGRKPLAIPAGLLKPSGNILTVKVYNRLFNYSASLKDNPVAARWYEMASNKSVVPAGMLGPVRLS